jgi:hypothetical protein
MSFDRADEIFHQLTPYLPFFSIPIVLAFVLAGKGRYQACLVHRDERAGAHDTVFRIGRITLRRTAPLSAKSRDSSFMVFHNKSIDLGVSGGLRIPANENRQKRLGRDESIVVPPLRFVSWVVFLE